MSNLGLVMPQESTKSVPPLTETNYNVWKFNMQARLMQSTVSWLVVSGVFPKPSPTAATAEVPYPPMNEEQRTWQIANLQAAGLIYNSVSAVFQPFIQEHLGDAKKMWEVLATRFQQQNATARFIILNDLLTVQKQPEDSLSTLIGKVDSALQALRASCKKDMKIEDLEEELAYSSLIRALPEEFASFRSSVLLVNGKDITYDKVKQAFLQEEQSRSASSAELAMRASTQSRGRGSGGRGRGSGRGRGRGGYSGPACTYPGCPNPTNHSLERCYARANAFFKQEEEKKKTGAPGAARQAQTSASIEEVAEFAGNASAFDPSDPLSPLVTDAGADWIVDTGATSHMTPHRHWFSSYTPHKRAIRLADEKVVYSVGIGSVRFIPCINGRTGRLLEFHDVLHVPSLRSNLLSVLSLTRCKQYTVLITQSAMLFK